MREYRSEARQILDLRECIRQANEAKKRRVAIVDSPAQPFKCVLIILQALVEPENRLGVCIAVPT